jgi:hypothetical protein
MNEFCAEDKTTCNYPLKRQINEFTETGSTFASTNPYMKTSLKRHINDFCAREQT